jgi:hypothetical protein
MQINGLLPIYGGEDVVGDDVDACLESLMADYLLEEEEEEVFSFSLFGR